MTETANTKRGFMDFSPPGKGDEQDKENDIPVLSLTEFTKPPFVSFGSVKLGTSRSALLRVENPADDVEVEVTVEKIPSVKGFSVDSTSFTIQPESSHTLTVTWTPTEEGGVRELIVFNADGVIRHQAVLLGQANALKTKKKSLWDSIKSRKGGDKAVTQRRKNAESHLKMGANRTFQVSRKSQYQRDRNRSPLVSLNEEEVVRRSSDGKRSTTDDQRIKAEEPLAVNAKQKLPTHGNIPNVLLVPTGTLSDSHKALNKTLSPIGTPNTLRKLMPRIQCPSPSPATDKLLSLTDALIMIGSDLTPIKNRPESPSDSRELSDSLESQRETFSPVTDARVLPHSPENATSHTNLPRLTFFVSKKGVNETAKCVNSATVTKGRAPPMVHVSGERRVKHSRRRLMEKTLELSDSSSLSNSESGPKSNTLSLPVMHPHYDLSPSISAPFILHPHPPSPSPSSVVLSTPLDTSSPVHCKVSPALTPVHQNNLSSNQCGKKRKSEEFLKAEDKEKEQVKKRTRVVVKPTCEEMKCSSQRSRTTVTSRSISTSLKTTKSRECAQAKQATRRVKTPASAHVKPARVVAVAQSKLTFIRPMQTALPRHPMPFAAKNMFYDERWIEKQERGFTWWINYVLTPEDFKVDLEVTKVNAVSLALGGSDKLSVHKAPTKEEMSFSTYTARRKLNRLRRSACQLFTSEAMVKAIQRLELEVEAQRLLVRKDRHLWKDIGERRKVLDWLLSYNPLWLRIGLETIYGELISLESNSDTLGLAMFVLHRLLWNPDIAAEFRHARVPHLYRDGHEEALSRFTLKKLLLLVCFLDKAKGSRLIEHDPCLFCVDAEFKSSKDLLLAFSRDFLSGEGILSRHLGYLGFPVSHVQTPLDEFNFAVKNLAVDLKCGIRLVRVVELLVHDWSLSAKLRLPAVSRLQKVHNVDVALQVLRCKGVVLKDEHGFDIDSRDIVDGHRDKTLGLLWKLIFAFQVEVILSEEQLRDEIGFLRRTLLSKQRRAFLRTNQNVQQSPVRAPYQHSSAKISLLMDWIRTVCDFYSLRVENFTVAFSDGRVLCYLIHHYHPALLPEGSVRHSTTQTVECSQRGRLELNCSTSDSDASFESLPAGLNAADSQSPEFKELLENEKSNFRLVNSAVAFLGGVPAMINPSDMSNTIPNEKVVMTFLSFLCVRLLDLRNETRAARVIQDAWRSHRLKKDLQLYTERNAAAVKIQGMVRSFLQKRRIVRENRAASIIQSSWRCHTARQQLKMKRLAELQRKQHHAATLIQAHWRRFAAMKAYTRLKEATMRIQAWWRMKRAVYAYAKILKSVAIVQTRWRAQTLMNADRQRFLLLRAAAVTIQRGVLKALRDRRRCRAATLIQAQFRMHRKRLAYLVIKRAVIAMQRRRRANLCRDAEMQRFTSMKRAAVVIQAAYRAHQARRTLALMNRAATIIQRQYLTMKQRRCFLTLRLATLTCQQRFRETMAARKQRRDYLSARRAVVSLQAAFRGFRTRKQLQTQHAAATTIQSHFRKHQQRQHYARLCWAATVLQQRYRANRKMRAAMYAFSAKRNATIILQAAYRGMKTRRVLTQRQHAASIIQRALRTQRQQRQYLCLKSSAITVQCRFRANQAAKRQREEYQKIQKAVIHLQTAFRALRDRRRCRAATLIQAQFRMHRKRSAYLAMKRAAIVMQRRRRANLCRDAEMQRFRSMKRAAIIIQAAYRAQRARRKLVLMHRAATVIQRRFLTMKQRRCFLTLRLATLTCQQRFRETMAARKQRSNYLSARRAAVSLQAAFRGFRTRKQLQTQHAAATTIQSHIRKHQQRQRYARLRLAATVLQRRHRANRKMRAAMKAFSARKKAAIVLQAVYRGMKTRHIVKQRQHAASIIQRALRTQRQRRRYLHLKSSAISVQRRFRANKAAKRQREEYQKIHKAVIYLQAAQRGRKVRKQVAHWHQAATVLQRAFRAQCEHKEFLQLKATVLILQRRYRANVAAKKQRKEYVSIQRAAVVLQAAYRGQRVREQVSHWHQAATAIQSAFRKHREEGKYKMMRQAVVTVQRLYRAKLLQRRQRETFLEQKHCVIVLQAAFRGFRTRKQLQKHHTAATTIQSHFRKHQQRQHYAKMRWATTVLQQRYRANRKMRAAMYAFSAKKKAAIVLQAAYRGMKTRRILAQRQQAVMIIQRALRTQHQRKQYLCLKSSAITVQRRFRANQAAKRQREEYQKIQKAVIHLQTAFRALRDRRRCRAATLIQAQFRMHRKRSAYLAMKRAAIVMQRRRRANLCRNAEMQRFGSMKAAAVIIQAAYRAHQARRKLALMHRAATVIQRRFLTMKQRRCFLTLRLATLTCQQRFRETMGARKQRSNYLSVRKAAVSLQAAFRGFRTRKQLQTQHAAATTIQSHVRKHQQRQHYTRLRWAATILQRRYRANRKMRAAMYAFSAKRNAAVILQAAYRGMKTRRILKQRQHAASIIQRALRTQRQQMQYLCLKSSAISVQRRFRANQAAKRQREEYQKIQKAVIHLQTAFRALRDRRRCRAATLIQAQFRMHRKRSAYLAMKRAAIVMQRRRRANLCRDAEMQRFRSMKAAAVIIQAAYRAHQARRKLALMHRAATVIQRRFLTMKQRRCFLTLRLATLTCQQRFRETLAARNQRSYYLSARKAAVSLQAAFRGFRTRKQLQAQHAAATTIQSHVRKHQQRQRYARLCWAATVLQQRYRANRKMRAAMYAFNAKRNAAIILQAAYRGMKTRCILKQCQHAASIIQRALRTQHQRRRYLRLKSSAINVQRRFRANKAAKRQREEYQKIQKAVVHLQAAQRGRKVREHVAHWHQAATVLQRAFRAHCEHKEFLQLKATVLILQKRYRANVTAMKQRKEYVSIKRASVVLQAAYRGQLVREQVSHWHQAATAIQSAFRKHREEGKYKIMRQAVVTVQRLYRAKLLQRRQRETFLEQKRCVIVLQAAFRGWKRKREMKQQCEAAKVIQAWWRRCVQRRHFLRLRWAVLTLQRRVRTVQLSRRQQEVEAAQAAKRLRFTSAAFHHLSAIKIQRAVRAHWALEAARRQIHSVLTIQRWVRARQQRRRYLEQQRKVLVAQRAVRQWLRRRHEAARLIQNSVRNFLFLKRRQRALQGIIKVQALWRGHCSRRQNDNPRLVKLRQRLREVTARAKEEDKLCNKTSAALKCLLHYKYISSILQALRNLETSTRLSPQCCERLVESGATEVLFILIRSCNRSLPCMDIITFCIQILLNLSKYTKTTAAVYSVDGSVETLLDLLQRYREKAGDKVAEKGDSIFTKACFLLALLLQEPQRAEEVMKMPRVVQRIRSIYRLTVRKQKMDAERTIVKQKTNASINGSFSVPATPRKSRPPPKFAPDWVLRKDKVKDIVNPLQAVQMVAEQLRVHL